MPSLALVLPLFFEPLLLLQGAQALAEKQPAKLTVEDISAQAKKAVVVVQFSGRTGKQQGLGTGFIISPDGLVATNYHVLGEARPLTVRMPDGTLYDVVSIHASDRALDLAIIKIVAKDLPVLPLGDSRGLKQGQPLVALGHPQGLEYSVVAGVLSGERKVDGLNMLQLAIPIEQGNSGGPVLDMQGKVVGIVTMKSLVTANLGFAVPSHALEPLLKRPNPIPMERWLTIGQLDKSEWNVLYGGRWRQHSGRIHADGTGTGFGGRTLCLAKSPPPKMPFEITVTVKLDDEAGAAGLLFGGDGADKHYGFYPSGGKLRLTRFNGPDVFSWKILEEIKTPHYRPGEWNTLKVKVDKKRFTCFVNDEQIVEHADPDYAGDVVGLAKFRETVAEYKRFLVAARVPTSKIDDKVASHLRKVIATLPAVDQAEVKSLAALLKSPAASMMLLRDQARQLEKQALQLRQLALTVHHRRTLAELAQALEGSEDKIDLARAALLVARLDNEELEVDAYLKDIERLARAIAHDFPKNAAPLDKLKLLNKALFEQRGFHGSRVEYYVRANSYLNEVLDDREGLPLTLSILYMELARRLDLNVVGLALPGHFVVRYEPAKGPRQIIDVYDAGKFLSDKEAAAKILNLTGAPLEQQALKATTKKAIIVRMLHNLINVAQNEQDKAGMLRYLDGIVAVDQDAHEERWIRAVFRYQLGQRQGALEDVDYLLDHAPPDVDLARVRELKRLLTR